MAKIRTRYAPSPTGFFHIGGARTALFNYLYTKHFNGDFILRIEDTDVERHIEDGIKAQFEGMKWLGMTPDESLNNPGKFGPYRQSEKFPFFKEIANELIEKGLAYYCFCTEQELEEARQIALAAHQTPKYNRKCLYLSKEEVQAKLDAGVPHVIRVKMPDDRDIVWNDLVRGKMSVPTSALTDPVIMRSNGIPMYNFSVVIDDYAMQISHVFRGEEHLSNTPYQIVIRELVEPLLLARGYEKMPEPIFGHMSIIVNETGKKLSKRDTTLKQFVYSGDDDDYISLGYHPDAIRNFITLLGWTPKGNEILSMQEAISQFDGSHLNPAPAMFDIKKMAWISGEYFKAMNKEDYLAFVKPFINVDLSFTNEKDLVLLTFQNQIVSASQINDLANEFFINTDLSQSLNIALSNGISEEDYYKCINTFKTILQSVDSITPENTNEIINKVKEISGLKGKPLFMPLRLIAIGKEHGPEMTKTLPIIGKEKILSNIK